VVDLKVLHITESFGGGVTSAINTYVSHSTQYHHFLFATVRDGDATGEEGDGLFDEVVLVERNIKAILKLHYYIKGLNPDVIHVHSTYAGFFVRLLPFVDTKKIVYTPHAFAFLRNDHPLKLRLYYSVERLLAKRCAVIAGCGRDEQLLSQKFKKVEDTFELINVCGSMPVVNTKDKREEKLVVMVGRICEQKGYDFFSQVASLVGSDVSFLWVGGGDADKVEVLQRAGVKVTGWLSRKEVVDVLSSADLYFHSAAWDGFPISVLEAAHYEIPTMLRRIGPFTAESLLVENTVAEAADGIRKYFNNDKDSIKKYRHNSSTIRAYHSSENLSVALDKLYSGFRFS